MGLHDHKEPVAKTETGPPTVEHRKAAQDAQMALGAAIALLVITGIAAVLGFSGIAFASAGICVALFVVGLMLHYESERQRQRPDPSRPRYGSK
jgi:uncharacterized membrane protein YtjA (UPF0391 family)